MVNPLMTQTEKYDRERERAKQYYQRNKARINARNTIYMREWREKNKDILREKVNDQKRRYYLANKDKVYANNRVSRLRHPETVRLASRRQKRNLKLEIFSHYGGGKVACNSCGYVDIRALTIDHINGGGCLHRKSLNGKLMYPWLKANGYPEGYQVLCMNCQFIKKDEEREYAHCNNN